MFRDMDDIFVGIFATILVIMWICLMGVMIASAMLPDEIADSQCIVYEEKLYCERSD